MSVTFRLSATARLQYSSFFFVLVSSLIGFVIVAWVPYWSCLLSFSSLVAARVDSAWVRYLAIPEGRFRCIPPCMSTFPSQEGAPVEHPVSYTQLLVAHLTSPYCVLILAPGLFVSRDKKGHENTIANLN